MEDLLLKLSSADGASGRDTKRAPRLALPSLRKPWLSLLREHLLASGDVSSAAVFDLSDGLCLEYTPGFPHLTRYTCVLVQIHNTVHCCSLLCTVATRCDDRE